MKQKIVGVYDMGWESVEIVLCEGQGGEVFLRPEKGVNRVGRIKVGADNTQWWSVVSTLLHETMEYSLCRMRCRYYCIEDLKIDQNAVVFSFDHQQFTEVCARAGEFIAAALPDMEKAWKKWRKKS